MGLLNTSKIVYTGKLGDIVRIPCRTNSSKLFFKGNGKAIKIYEALLGKKHERNRTGMTNMEYFGLTSAKDASEVSYTTGYTATHAYGNTYNVKANVHSEGDFIAMEIIEGASSEVANDKKSNVNKWLNAVSKPTRGFTWWLVGVVTSPFVIGLLMLASAVYRVGLSFVKKSCLKKAKRSYKKNKKVIVF